MTPCADHAMGRPIALTLRRIAVFLLCGALPLAAEGGEQAGDIFDQASEIIDIIRGVHSFLSGIALISETIGFATVLLFLAVILFSAGLTAVGVPKGAPSFIASLLMADLIWVLWSVSLKASPGEIAVALFRSNLILAAPAVVIAIAARTAAPAVARLRRVLAGLFTHTAILDAEEAAALFREYQERSSRLSSSLAGDIASSPGKDGAPISGETAKRAGELGEILERIRGRNGR